MRKDQFNDIVKWQNETFGKATALSKLAHLKEELYELTSDLKNNSKGKRLEYADCFLLLFGSAGQDGMTYEDICDAIDEKMSINRERQWSEPDEDGISRHI